MKKLEIIFYKAAYILWCLKLPKRLRLLALKFNPWNTYEIIQTGQLCQVVGVDLEGGLTVNSWDREGFFTNYNVFGVKPDDLKKL